MKTTFASIICGKTVGLTQAQFAAIGQSSQSRVSEVESGDISGSIDLLVRNLLVLGASRDEPAEVLTA